MVSLCSSKYCLRAAGVLDDECSCSRVWIESRCCVSKGPVGRESDRVKLLLVDVP